MSIPKPNYTQTPNVIFDLLPQMKEAEIRVTMLIVRETFGWHRESSKLSIAEIQLHTNLSRQGVINGIEKGMERGTIIREKDGESYRYRLNVNEVDTDKEVVNLVDQQTIVSSQPSRPALVNLVDQQTPIFPEVEATSKESIKESIKERESVAAQRTTASPPSPTYKPILDSWILLKKEREARCVINYAAETKAAKALAKEGWTPDQVLTCATILYNDPFYGSSALSLWTVAKQIAAKHTPPWKRRQSPPPVPQVLDIDWTEMFT